ncbi:hypothetical protein ACRAWC_22600 [Leifsonia sp. L25]|uniref:hypothetical protein n=1 Tax=Leifsonia sp. L25 TaxID=3423957 RepID=UPI003D69399A
MHVVDEAGEPVVFQNSQSTATTDDVSRGAVVFRAEVLALGYRLYRLRPGAGPGAAAGGLTVTADTLENEHVRIRIDQQTGWISSYLLKATGVDVMAGVDGARAHADQRRPDRHLGPPGHLVRVAGRHHGAEAHRRARDRAAALAGAWLSGSGAHPPWSRSSSWTTTRPCCA